MNAHGCLVDLAIVFFLIVFVLILRIRIWLLSRYAIPFLYPRTEIDKPAPLGTKWPIGIIFPGDFGSTSWTLNHGHLSLPQEFSVPDAKRSSTVSFFSIRPWSSEYSMKRCRLARFRLTPWGQGSLPNALRSSSKRCRPQTKRDQLWSS